MTLASGDATTDAALTPYMPMHSVKEFHKAFEVTPFIEEKDNFGRQKMLKLRLKLIQEEFREVADELLDGINGDGDWMRLAKEMADLLYVVYGTADLLDIPLEKAFNAVHKSNMSKLGEDGKPIRRGDGKILKGKNYQEPDMSVIFS